MVRSTSGAVHRLLYTKRPSLVLSPSSVPNVLLKCVQRQHPGWVMLCLSGPKLPKHHGLNFSTFSYLSLQTRLLQSFHTLFYRRALAISHKALVRKQTYKLQFACARRGSIHLLPPSRSLLRSGYLQCWTFFKICGQASAAHPSSSNISLSLHTPGQAM